MTVIYRSPPFDLEGYVAFTVKYADGSSRTVLEHHEIMESHLGKPLLDTEVVHHKDGNKKNNVVGNFEVLTRQKHAKLHAKPTEKVECTCPCCHTAFFALARNVRHNQHSYGKAGPFCGKLCAGKYGAAVKYGRVLE